MTHPSHITEALQPVRQPEPTEVDECLNISSSEEQLPEFSSPHVPHSFSAKLHAFGLHLNPGSVHSCSPEPTTAVTPKADQSRFDGFLQAIVSIAAVKDDSERGRTRTATEEKRTVYLSKSATPLRKEYPREELLKAKELARIREIARNRRVNAVSRIQRWWRRILYFQSQKRSVRLAEFQAGVMRAAYRIALFALAAVLKSARKAQVARNAEILNRYLNACAGVIQRWWRAHARLRDVKHADRRKATVLAAVKGWKTRRILHSWPLLEVKQRFSVSAAEDRKLIVLELIQTFREEYRCGKWMRKRRQRNVSNIEHIRKPSAASISPIRVKPDRGHSPCYSCNLDEQELPKNQAAVARAEKRVMAAKPFLKRKTRRVAMQKVSWSGVGRRVNCWSETSSPDTKKPMERPRPVSKSPTTFAKNSLDEFLEMERLSLDSGSPTRTKLPIPAKRTKAKRTASPLKSLLPKKTLKLERPMKQLPPIKSQAGSDDEASEYALCSTFDSSQDHRARAKFVRELFSTVGDRDFPSDSD